MIERNIRGGVKNGNGSFTDSSGGGWLAPDQRNDLRSFLIGEGWNAAQRFRAGGDERGSARLAGWVVWTLHRRVVDWLRLEFGSTREGRQRPPMVELDLEMHDVAAIDEDIEAIADGRWLDHSHLSERATEALAIYELAVETDTSPSSVVRELGIPPCRLTVSGNALRAEAIVRG